MIRSRIDNHRLPAFLLIVFGWTWSWDAIYYALDLWKTRTLPVVAGENLRQARRPNLYGGISSCAGSWYPFWRVRRHRLVPQRTWRAELRLGRSRLRYRTGCGILDWPSSKAGVLRDCHRRTRVTAVGDWHPLSASSTSDGLWRGMSESAHKRVDSSSPRPRRSRSYHERAH